MACVLCARSSSAPSKRTPPGPVDVALKDATGRTWTVGASTAERPSDGASSTLPFPVQEFISDFDHGRPVQPFDFDIPKPETV